MDIANLILGLVEKLLPLAIDAYKANGANSEAIKAALVAAIAETHAAITGMDAQFAADDAAALAAAKLKP